MASKELPFQTHLQDIRDEGQCLSPSSPPESCFEESTTSEYSTLDEESLFGSVQDRKPRQNQAKTADVPPGLFKKVLTEPDATEISNIIGGDWRLFGRNLKVPENTLESISEDMRHHKIEDKAHFMLMKYIQQEGFDATIGRVAEALLKIRRRDVAEILIGTEYFASKATNEQTFTLKKEGSFDVPVEDGQVNTFLTCRDTVSGRLYLVRELAGTGYEESCKALQKQDTIADSLLKVLDVNGVERAEKQKKEAKNFQEAQDRIMELVKSLKEISTSFENQERNIDEIKVSQQLAETKGLLGKAQSLVSGLLQLTGIVSHLKDPFPLKAQIHSFSLGLSATLKDFERGIMMLKQMVPSDKEVLGKEPEKLLKWIQGMEKTIKMRENAFVTRFKKDSLEDQQRPRIGQNCASSEPPPRITRCQVDAPGIRRPSSQPVSEEDLKSLREQVAPAPDPMEEKDGFSSIIAQDVLK